MSDIIPSKAGLFRKLAEVMAEVGRVGKDGFNDFHKYAYVTEAALVEEVRGKLAERNVALIPSLSSTDERPYETDKGKHSVVTTAHVAFTFVDGDTGAMFKAEWAGQGDDPADKGLYKAYTGALKYFLMKTFLIPTGDDPEADTRADERSQGRTAPRTTGRPSGRPSEPQLKLIKTLITQKHVTSAQLRMVLEEVGATGVQLTEGWMEHLTAGKEGTASALITYLKERPLPDPEHPSDVDNSGFEQPPLDESGTPWEGS